jgi:hypothetical protein
LLLPLPAGAEEEEGAPSGGGRCRKPCETYDSRPDEATNPPVGRFESLSSQRRYDSSAELPVDAEVDGEANAIGKTELR